MISKSDRPACSTSLVTCQQQQTDKWHAHRQARSGEKQKKTSIIWEMITFFRYLYQTHNFIIDGKEKFTEKIGKVCWRPICMYQKSGAIKIIIIIIIIISLKNIAHITCKLRCTLFLYLFICISSYRDWHKPFLISSYYICLYVILITHNSILLSVLLVYFLFCLRFFLTKPTMLWPFWLSRKAAPNRAITQGQLYLSECIWRNLSHYLIVSALGLVHLFK